MMKNNYSSHYVASVVFLLFSITKIHSQFINRGAISINNNSVLAIHNNTLDFSTGTVSTKPDGVLYINQNVNFGNGNIYNVKGVVSRPVSTTSAIFPLAYIDNNFIYLSIYLIYDRQIYLF